jgi:hypothetical protein
MIYCFLGTRSTFPCLPIDSACVTAVRISSRENVRAELWLLRRLVLRADSFCGALHLSARCDVLYPVHCLDRLSLDLSSHGAGQADTPLLVNMGALAIKTLAGARLILSSRSWEVLHDFQPFIGDLQLEAESCSQTLAFRSLSPPRLPHPESRPSVQPECRFPCARYR